jgi:glyoxylase-like metal-dependent hydrolase (beta-lactamase superfamily II)
MSKLRLHAMTCGWLTAPTALFLAGEKGRLRIPVPCYLIEHPRGRVLFDSGMPVAAQGDPEDGLGPAAPFFEVDFKPGEELGARLAAQGVDAAGVRYLVNSHLHFDHAGGNAQVPNAQLIVQRREWDAGADADLVARNFFDPRHYDLGHDVKTVEGEYDLFGDGSVVCIPTYGHTPGHQSLRVRLPAGDVVLAADACYMRQTLLQTQLPGGAIHDRDAMLASLDVLRKLQRAGARIFYGHDPEFWAGVPQAPAEIL